MNSSIFVEKNEEVQEEDIFQIMDEMIDTFMNARKQDESIRKEAKRLTDMTKSIMKARLTGRHDQKVIEENMLKAHEDVEHLKIVVKELKQERKEIRKETEHVMRDIQSYRDLWEALKAEDEAAMKTFTRRVLSDKNTSHFQSQQKIIQSKMLVPQDGCYLLKDENAVKVVSANIQRPRVIRVDTNKPTFEKDLENAMERLKQSRPNSRCDSRNSENDITIVDKSGESNDKTIQIEQTLMSLHMTNMTDVRSDSENDENTEGMEED